VRSLFGGLRFSWLAIWEEHCRDLFIGFGMLILVERGMHVGKRRRWLEGGELAGKGMRSTSMVSILLNAFKH
jgi:hypothetical protein